MLTLDPQGRIVIPASLRRELGLERGTSLVASVEDGRLVLQRPPDILRRLRAELKASSAGRASVVDELIAERREEARREEAENAR
jgi:AbrB family looped-hinge helix DNA binding protein